MMRNLLVPTILALSLLACSDAEEADGLASLKGSSWKGQFSPASSDVKVASLPVSFSFKQDDTFQTVSLENIQNVATGNYRDMPRHKTLLLEVNESSFQTFSLQNKSKAFEYSLEGDELILENKDGTYTLVKEDKRNGDPTNPFFGTFNCEDNQMGGWSVDLNESSFFGRRIQKGTRALNVNGIVTYEKSSEQAATPDLAFITLQDSNQGQVTGMRFKATIQRNKRSNKTKFAMQEIMANGQAKKNGLTIDCRRG